MDKIKIVGIIGSLRKDSYNKMLFNASKELIPDGVELVEANISDLPLYNDDLMENIPESVKKFKNDIKDADAFLFVTPEYNYSVPGVLKNAIDWASRPYDDNSLYGKPAAMMSASVGMLGGARAQYHLRQSFVFLNMFTINRPEVFISFAQDKFDKAGNLTDEKAKEIIRKLFLNLVDLTKILESGKDIFNRI